MAVQRQDEFAPFSALYEGYARLYFDGDLTAMPLEPDQQLTVGRSVFRSITIVESELRDRGMHLRADARLGLATVAIAWAAEPRLVRGNVALDDLAADLDAAMRLVIGRTSAEDDGITLQALTTAIVDSWGDLKDIIWR